MIADRGLARHELLLVPRPSSRTAGSAPPRSRPCAAGWTARGGRAGARGTGAPDADGRARQPAPAHRASSPRARRPAGTQPRCEPTRRRLRARPGRDRRGDPQWRAAARRGAGPLARRHRHGRPHARAGVAARPAARPRALARHGSAGRRGRAADRGGVERRRGRLTPRPTGRPSALRPRGAGGRRAARCSRARRAAGRRLAGAAGPHPRGGPGVAGRRVRARPPRGRGQALDGALRIARRQRRRARRDARRVRPARAA